MGRSAIQIVVIFFDILTMVTFFACQSKESLFKDRVTSVPEGQRKTHLLMAITDTAKSILSPTEGLRTRVVMRKVIPGCAIGAVVFTHRSPGPFTQISSPHLPLNTPTPRLLP